MYTTNGTTYWAVTTSTTTNSWSPVYTYRSGAPSIRIDEPEPDPEPCSEEELLEFLNES